MTLRRNIVFLTFVLFFLGLPPLAISEGHTSAADILARADAIRFPPGDHQFQAAITFHRPDHRDETGVYQVLTKGRDRTLIEILSPETDHGNSLLMVGHDLWIFIKDVSQPVRISFQQRLMGDIANGDLARANFVGDYTATLVKQDQRFYILNLAAKSEDVTYSRVLLAVEKNSFRPMRAQFFAASGKLLKTGAYEDYRPFQGAYHPMRITFDNPLLKDQKSVIVYKEMTTEKLPDKYFTKDYLKKLKY